MVIKMHTTSGVTSGEASLMSNYMQDAEIDLSSRPMLTSGSSKRERTAKESKDHQKKTVPIPQISTISNRTQDLFNNGSKRGAGDYDGDESPKIKKRVNTRISALVGSHARPSISKEGLSKNRHESFKELMLFNLETEFALAERNLTVVNATQQFVNKALKKSGVMRIKKDNLASTQNLASAAAQDRANDATRKAKTSIIKQQNATKTVFKGINIMTSEDGFGLKFSDQPKPRKVKFDV